MKSLDSSDDKDKWRGFLITIINLVLKVNNKVGEVDDDDDEAAEEEEEGKDKEWPTYCTKMEQSCMLKGK